METFKIIRERRQMLRLTQERLANEAGISLRTIKLIENGSGNPSLSTLSKICNALGMEILIRKRTSKLHLNNFNRR